MKLNNLNFCLQVVVILVIWVISILVIYMGFLSCLDPILNKRAILRTSQSVTYREHHDERTSDDEGSGGERAQVNSRWIKVPNNLNEALMLTFRSKNNSLLIENKPY